MGMAKGEGADGEWCVCFSLSRFIVRGSPGITPDPSITFCPRDSCQAAVPKLSEDEEKLRVCPSCVSRFSLLSAIDVADTACTKDYSFCVFCRHGWHGARNACALPQSSAIVSAYLSGTDDERRTLELRYGTANIKRLVAAYEEEKALQEWLAKNSTQCPGCGTPIEKSQGCNVRATASRA